MTLATIGSEYHVGIITADLDRAMTEVGALLGVRWADVIDGVPAAALLAPGGQTGGLLRAVHSWGGPPCVELLEGEPDSVWFTDQLATLHHHAYWADDIAGSVERLQRDGWSLEVTMPDGSGAPSSFAYLTKPGLARVQLTDASRRTDTLARLGWTV